MEIIQQGVEFDKRAADSLIAPYKTDYLFHCVNLRGTAGITLFYLRELHLLNTDKAVLMGDVLFNGEPLKDGVVVEMSSRKVYYRYRGRLPKYDLTIDPAKKELWASLLGQLGLALSHRDI